MRTAQLLTICISLAFGALCTCAVQAASRGNGAGGLMVAEASACPADAQAAAADLWPMADGFGRQMSRLKGKHPCGRWLICERAYPSKGWQCRWDHKNKGS